MKRKMTHTVRTELADAIRLRYRSATGKQKRKILDEFVASTGYHEKSAIRVLNAQSAPKARQTRNRPSLYDEAARGALIILWEASDRVCGKRLKALLPHFIVSAGAQRTFEARRYDSRKDTRDECSDDRPTAARAALRDTLEEASPGRAGAAPAHTAAHFCGLE
jgi:hypothetical protein